MELEKTERTAMRQHRERASYQREVVYAILDEAPICHVGFVAEGQPFVIPTIHARDGDALYLHGGIGSRLLAVVASGAPVCVTATLLDGLVLARSVFSHSMNYRSAVVVGRGAEVTDPDAKLRGLRVVTEHVLPGRWADARQPSRAELAATRLVRLPLGEASAKVRAGPPADDLRSDVDLPVWAGVIPLGPLAGTPVPAPDLAPGIPLPAYVDAYVRAHAPAAPGAQER